MNMCQQENDLGFHIDRHSHQVANSHGTCAEVNVAEGKVGDLWGSGTFYFLPDHSLVYCRRCYYLLGYVEEKKNYVKFAPAHLARCTFT